MSVVLPNQISILQERRLLFAILMELIQDAWRCIETYMKSEGYKNDKAIFSI